LFLSIVEECDESEEKPIDRAAEVLMNALRRVAARFAPWILVVLIAASVGGCAISGEVRIAFFWDGNLTAFSSGIPNVPKDHLTLDKGTYYLTFSGTYQLSYTLDGFVQPSQTFTIEAQKTVLGKEDAYYNVHIRQGPPIIERFP
jgi:hypothetical protein